MGWKGAPPPMPSYNDPNSILNNPLGAGLGIASYPSMTHHPSMIHQQGLLTDAYRNALNMQPPTRTPTDKVLMRATDLGILPINANLPKLGSYLGYQTETNAGLFIVYDNKPYVLEDDEPSMFPSDSFMTKLRLLLK